MKKVLFIAVVSVVFCGLFNACSESFSENLLVGEWICVEEADYELTAKGWVAMDIDDLSGEDPFIWQFGLDGGYESYSVKTDGDIYSFDSGLYKYDEGGRTLTFVSGYGGREYFFDVITLDKKDLIVIEGYSRSGIGSGLHFVRK